MYRNIKLNMYISIGRTRNVTHQIKKWRTRYVVTSAHTWYLQLSSKPLIIMAEFNHFVTHGQHFGSREFQSARHYTRTLPSPRTKPAVFPVIIHRHACCQSALPLRLASKQYSSVCTLK